MQVKKFALGFLLIVGLFTYAQDELSKKDRLLSIDLTTASDDDFGKAFTLAREAGMQVTSLSLAWDELEPSPGQYGTELNWLEIFNDFYSEQDIAISLSLTPIDTNNLRLPEYLKNKAFDDPEVIEAFKRLLDYVFSQIPDLELSCLSIGNEIDGYLATDKELWQQYTIFFREIYGYIKSKYPELLVGSKIGFGGLTGTAYALSADLIKTSDVVMLTYYPLEPDFTVKEPVVIHEDFAKLVELFPDKAIFVLESGYPSSPLLGSSEAKQAEFVREIFRAWDTYSENIKLLDFLWLHDLPPMVVEELGGYYGLDDEKFLAYLATLGLRTFDGEDKQAFQVLQEEASRRGW